ncbi:MAG: hypothetical protein JWQ09_3596, partial [Segetibacter sp.]|nr:hypothetical protein [Segetibacter sp.]
QNKSFYQNRTDYNIADFISKLIEDDSHITFKLRQTLNFLKFKHLDLSQKIVSLGAFSRQISGLRRQFKLPVSEVINMIPPPIFKIDIICRTRDEEQKQVNLMTLSSGEKQLVYSVSSILYHLYNLNSIRRSKSRKAYNYINIILEEIELYFHPELQRTYIKTILDSLSQLRFNRIDSINFCFVTHSPFILSDIPNTNILFLQDDGRPVVNVRELRTFGGNIHDLLANSFFLSNGFIGEFAKEKIQEVIIQLSKGSKVETYTEDEIRLIINLIGEPFLREKLMEMYYLKYSKKKRIEDLKAEIKRLEND